MKKPIKDLDKFREQFVRWTLRRASFRWPPRGEALKAARIERGLYQCNLCKGRFKNKEVKVDHVDPVVPILSNSCRNVSPSTEQFVQRMFPAGEGFQVLCKPCHDNKTRSENEQRRESRKLQKARGLRKRNSGSERRRLQIQMGPSAMEGSQRPSEGSDVRGKEVQSQWVAFCPECAGKVYSRADETLICDECRREY